MRRGARVGLALLIAAGALTLVRAQGVQPANDAANPYQTVTGWAKMPEGRTWGSLSAVDIAPDRRSIWVAERCGQNPCAGSTRPVVLKFDASGKMVTSFGAGMFVFPHGIHVDHEGNVWVTDARAANAEELATFAGARGRATPSSSSARTGKCS